MKSENPTTTKAWASLSSHFKKIEQKKIKLLFKNDGSRFQNFSLSLGEIVVDFSKNKITKETIQLLVNLAIECGLKEAIPAMFLGKKINYTEQRAVLHTALRNRKNVPTLVDGENVMPKINQVLSKMKSFSDSIHSGTRTGFSNKKIQSIITIGIGGSHLGPQMVCEALLPYKVKNIDTYFISNIDGTDIVETLKKVNPETSLFLIASKTFKTEETMTNADTARKWILDFYTTKKAISSHFVALSTNKQGVEDFGIDPDNMFEFWDWVGGRYSLWSAIGLSITLSIGYANFENLLEGAYTMDSHFKTTPLEKNIPVILALISIWHTNFHKYTTETVLPYDKYMHLFSTYLQQVSMESNGKCIDNKGNKINYKTGSILWGGTGTNGQHAFYQLIHQGTSIIPCDFIACAKSHNPTGSHHLKLMANFFAQTEALMNGKTIEEVLTDLEKEGLTKEEAQKIAPHKVFDGDRPSNSILLKELTPHTLGMLIAMYEHKVFVQGTIWNINSFDQWGVELGKKFTTKILSELSSNKKNTAHDSSTNGLIDTYITFKNA